MSSSGFRDGLGERDLAFDRQTGDVWERLFLRPELSAFEAALRRRIAQFSAFQSTRLVPLRGVDKDPASPKLVVVSRHVPGARLSDVLRGARERELVPDFTVALLLSAEIFASLHAFHTLANVSHGALGADRIIVSPAGEVLLADFAFGEVLEAAQLSARRLWEQFGVAHWYDAPFSIEADLRHAALVTIALMLGRPLDHEEFPGAIDRVVAEVEEAAMIRAGRLFAEPVVFWLTRALAAGTPAGFESAGETAEACLALLTERECEAARPALVQFLDESLAPLPEPEPVRPVSAAVPPRVETAPQPEPAFEPLATFEPAPVFEPTIDATASTAPLQPFVESEPEPAFEPIPEPAPEPSFAQTPITQFEPLAEPEPEPDSVPAPPIPAPEPAFAWTPIAPGEPFAEPEPAPDPVPEPPIPAPAPPPRPFEPPRIEYEPPTPAVAWSPPSSPYNVRSEQGSQVVSPSPFAALEDAPASRKLDTPAAPPPVPFAPYSPPPAPPPVAASPYAAPPVPAAPPIPEPLVQGPSVTFAPAAITPPPAPARPDPFPPLTPPAPIVTPPSVVPAAAPIESQPAAIKLKATPGAAAGAPPRRVTPSRGLNLSDYGPTAQTEPDQQAQFARFWKIVAGGAVLLVAGLAAAQVEWTTPEVKIAPGVLVVETTPPGSDVRIDGQVRGKTPVTLEVDPGKHEIELGREGATHSWSVEVVSGARRVERLDWSALKGTGGIEVVTNSPGAVVLVDGERRGQTPLVLTDLTPGRHTVVVQGSSGTIRRTVTIAAGKTVKIDLQIYSGWIVVSAPIELQVVEKGAVIGTAGEGPIVLSAGRHEIELVNEALGYRSTRTVDIRPGEEDRITVTPYGVANINAIPWAEVFVDGTSLGTTPLANVNIPLGTREIVFKHPQHGERRVTVTVTASQPAQVGVDFTKPGDN